MRVAGLGRRHEFRFFGVSIGGWRGAWRHDKSLSLVNLRWLVHYGSIRSGHCSHTMSRISAMSAAWANAYYIHLPHNSPRGVFRGFVSNIDPMSSRSSVSLPDAISLLCIPLHMARHAHASNIRCLDAIWRAPLRHFPDDCMPGACRQLRRRAGRRHDHTQGPVSAGIGRATSQ